MWRGRGALLLGFGASLLLACVVPARAADPGSAAPKPKAKPKPILTEPNAATEEETPPVSLLANFGEWTLICAKGKEAGGSEPCSLAQALIERQSQKLVFRVMFGYGAKGHLLLQVDSPTGVALQKGIEFSPDEKKVYRLPFQTCLPRGCKAVLAVPEELKGELAKSDRGTITVYTLNGQAMRAVTMLSGLNEGLAALDKRRTAGQ